MIQNHLATDLVSDIKRNLTRNCPRTLSNISTGSELQWKGNQNVSKVPLQAENISGFIRSPITISFNVTSQFHSLKHCLRFYSEQKLKLSCHYSESMADIIIKSKSIVPAPLMFSWEIYEATTGAFLWEKLKSFAIFTKKLQACNFNKTESNTVAFLWILLNV